MRKGTFSVQKANSNSAAHNSRKVAPRYLIGLEKNRSNFYELFQSDKDFIEEAKIIYKNKIGQQMQKKQIPNLIQETVLTLKKNQDENDVKKLFEKLKNKFGGHTLLEISIHRDEGHYEKDGIAFYLTKNMLKKNNEYFIKSDTENKIFDKKIDIETFEKVYNYHAHAKFSMFDKELGKTARMQKKDMSERIKFVSQELGLKFSPDKKTSRIKKSVGQVKNEHFSKAQTLQKYNFREMQKEISNLKNANSAQKRELHQLNSKVRNGKEKEELLHKKISAYKEEFSNLESLANAELSSARSIIDNLKKENLELKKKNTELEKTVNKYAKYIYDSQAAAGAPAAANQIKSKNSYQQKIFYEIYKSEIDDILKNFYITRDENFTKFSNKKKKIEVIDKGDAIESNSENLKESVKLMLDIAVAKKWKIEDIKLQGTPEFKEEARLQIAARIEKNRLNGLQATKKVEEVQNPVKVEKVTQSKAMTVENEDFTEFEKQILERETEVAFEEGLENVDISLDYAKEIFEIQTQKIQKTRDTPEIQKTRDTPEIQKTQNQNIEDLDYGLAR